MILKDQLQNHVEPGMREECMLCKGKGFWLECRRSRKNRDFIKRHVCLACKGTGYWDHPCNTSEAIGTITAKAQEVISDSQ